MKITEKNTNEVCDEDVIITSDISKEEYILIRYDPNFNNIVASRMKYNGITDGNGLRLADGYNIAVIDANEEKDILEYAMICYGNQKPTDDIIAENRNILVGILKKYGGKILTYYNKYLQNNIN